MRAFIAEKTDDDVSRGLRELDDDELGDGDVVIRVEWSSVNYKDALATIAKGQVARISPLVPGIDLAGVVESAPSSAPVSEGDAVLAHGYDLGVAHHGGYAERARVPADWVVPLPENLSARDAMAIGTAGYTAALCVIALEDRGLSSDAGPVLVTGASGGVGSVAVDILAGRGYEVVASTGKDAEDWLKSLGAASVVSRSDVIGDPKRPLGKAQWAGVGGLRRRRRAGGRPARLEVRRRGRRLRQHRGRRPADLRAAVHPARGRTAGHRLRGRPRSTRAGRPGPAWPATCARSTCPTRSPARSRSTSWRTRSTRSCAASCRAGRS